jgi:hypothetical protein
MLLKVVIYIFIVFALIIDRQTIRLTERVGLHKGSYYAIFLFIVYLFLLYMELKIKINQAVSPNLLEKKTFIFSFSIGIIWGVLISFSGGFHYKVGVSEILFILLGYVFLGIIFAIIGNFFLKFLWNKYKMSSHRNEK